MALSLVMTVIGRDRPGLVESVATLVAEHGGNWLESRMSRLGGQFAGILRVQVPEQQQAALLQKLERLNTTGLTVVVQRDEAEPQQTVPNKLHVIDIVGQDRPGIVKQISAVLAKSGVNVEELETECASAAMSGETLFKAHATVGLPSHCDAAELRRQLEKIAEDLIVEIAFEEVKPR